MPIQASDCTYYATIVSKDSLSGLCRGPKDFSFSGGKLVTNKIVIVVNGRPQCGKDTFSENIRKICHSINSNLIFDNNSTVDHIKIIAKNHFNWNGEKDEKGRRLLSDLKDASTRYDSGPFEHIVDLINCIYFRNVDYPENYYVITVIHSREPDEISKFAEYFGETCKTVLIKRSNNVEISCHADANVDDYPYDYILENNGTPEKFYKTCERFVEDLNIT